MIRRNVLFHEHPPQRVANRVILVDNDKGGAVAAFVVWVLSNRLRKDGRGCHEKEETAAGQGVQYVM